MRDDGVLGSSASSPKPWHCASARLPESLPPKGPAFRASSPPPAVEQGTPVSVLNLITALPLLLSLDRSHYTAALNNGQEILRDTCTVSAPQRGNAFRLVTRRTVCPSDAATAAVRAVLNARGTPSWNARRQRLRQLALDSFFCPNLSARISQRRGCGPEGGDGVREAVAGLLLHARTVMSVISPTQAYLVDLFAAQIMCGAHSSGSAATGAPRADTLQGMPKAPDAEDGHAPGSASPLNVATSEEVKPVSELRGIMARGGSASAPVTASPRHKQDDATSLHASTTIAEQLLYIILRTSIAANTPRRSFTVYGEDAPAHLADGLRTPPPQQIAGVVGLTSELASTASSSVVDRLTHKKPRVDGFGDDDHSALFIGSGQSVYHHCSSAASVRSDAILPYQPHCWLAPSTVALVERSQALRRQQRWTCDLDPVIEATIAREASCTRNSHLLGGAGTRSAAVLSLLDSMRCSWAPLAGMAESDDAATLTALVTDSGFSFSRVSTSDALNAGHEAKLGSFSGGFQWESVTGAAEDPAVEALFSDTPSRCINLCGSETHGGPGNEEAILAKQQETEFTAMALPACRTPFVTCHPLYDDVVYAQVHLALHWCTAGFADPFCLTYCDDTAGANLPALRVRKEFYHNWRRTNDGVGPPSAAVATSGLASLLEWGCGYGTLLRCLYRLCDLADDVTQRGTLGSYGRCAMSTLRLLLCLLQRQIGELGDQTGGPHRLSFAELLTAHQRLQRAVVQIDVLAVFFGVSAAAVAPSTGDGASSSAAETWDPVRIFQQRCSSALLLSRLYECFISRHADALGQHGSAATRHHELQQDRLAEMLAFWADEGADTMPFQAKTRSGAPDQQWLPRRDVFAVLGSGKTAPAMKFLPPGADYKCGAWEQQRKEVLSTSIDAIGLLLRATLRPLNTMLNRWLTAGELVDPYDEFFVVPSHGETHSGFTLDLSPQRLPVFLSAAAATDILHAGVSLRVLRAAAAHVVLSAKKDARRLECLAEINEAAAEDYMGEMLDTQTLRRAVDQFIERLLRGGSTEDAVTARGCAGKGTLHQDEAADTPTPPLPPRVDALSSYGAIGWWKEHYQACTRVMLEVVGEAASPGKGSDEEDWAEAAPGPLVWLREDADEGLRGAVEAATAEEDRVDGVASSGTHTSRGELSFSHSPATAAAACCPGAGEPDDHCYSAFPQVMTVFSPMEPTSEGPSFITVFMNSDDDEDRGLHGDMARAAGGQQAGDNLSACSSPRASTTTASVLGLRRIASSRFSTGTTLTSMASSRGTMALYGAITEELRQVSLLEQQTEADLGQSRHLLRAEFDAQLWRRRREGRLNDWKAQRLALRLRRVRAMENIVDELRDVYIIRAVGHAEIQGPASHPIEETPLAHQSRCEEGAGQEPSLATSAMAEMRVVVPPRQLPPPRVAPPVILYAVSGDDSVGDLPRGRRGSRAFDGRSRRTSFAANPTIVEAPTITATRRPEASRFCTSPLSQLLPTGLPQMPRAGACDNRFPCGPQPSAASASGLVLSKWPRTLESPSLAVRTTTRVPAASARTGALPFISTPLTRTCVQSTQRGFASSAMNSPLRDAAPAALSTFEVKEGIRPPEQARAAIATFDVPFTSTLLPVQPSPSAIGHRQKVEASLPREHAALAAAASADAAHVAAVRRDEFGYRHPDALFRVSDINDDEFLLMRTGPKSYARREAEEAALTQLSERQEQLAACTVDDPVYLRLIAAAAAAAAGEGFSCNTPEDNTEYLSLCRSSQRRQSLSLTNTQDAAALGCRAEEDVEAGDSAGCYKGNVYLPRSLDSAWQRDDPQRGSSAAKTAIAGAAATGKSCTDELWSWTAAEAHRWYFDGLIPVPRVLTGGEVDRALLMDAALTYDEVEALQRCSGYYRALGQYTASFLTHKALQFTLLPPYGSLYRLTTQFLDVCLLQSAPIAVRLMDVWVSSVDAALEMIAEGEEATMVQAIVREEAQLSALAALRENRHGLDLAEVLSSLNASFQREWATCVTDGDSTVKLEWRLTSDAGEGHERLGSAGEVFEGDGGFAEGDEAAESGDGGVSRGFSIPLQPTQLSQDSAKAASQKSFSIQSFVSSLSLTAVSPWCNGAWLLPDDILHCAGAIFRSLLFWKSAERIVLHTWRAGMDSGLSGVFFFCTTVRQVLVSSLQETLWARLAELTAAYRESLQFEAGVLYTYRALESFTIDHAEFLRECEFYTLCGPQFQRRVYPVLQAMVSTVEEAERALRYAQVSIRLKRRQCMATFRSMVSSGGSSDSDSDGDGDGAAGDDSSRQTKVRPPATSTPGHTFTPSRWSRRAVAGKAWDKEHAGGGAPQASPWYLQPLEDALARHFETLTPPTATGSGPIDAGTHDTESDVQSARTPPRSAEKGTKGRAAQAERTLSPALIGATAAHSTIPMLDKPPGVESRSPGAEKTTHYESPSPSAETPHRKRHRQGTQPGRDPQQKANTAALRTKTPQPSTVVRHPQTQKRSRSVGVTTRQPVAPPPPPAPEPTTKTGVSKTAVPAMKRPRRSHCGGKRLSSTKRKERRAKLHAIAERNINEEVAHQRRLMRDMVSRELGLFASLTRTLRDALAEVMVGEDVKSMEAESSADAAATSADGASLKSIRELHKAQQRRMSRYVYISAILRRLDALIEVMASQV
ncbi:hypothetical protein JKF63_00219 [Porcisia hertigi]|uniref:Gamma tubulin complex component protein N-terminal domain-containing protein n=1 Tax=Porcisia hertigi TaxID=2761500 RepID=A0A836L0V9_9TRYP|nr:hypothetical protein JKF63_00219 [Porcisia hertigi]